MRWQRSGTRQYSPSPTCTEGVWASVVGAGIGGPGIDVVVVCLSPRLVAEKYDTSTGCTHKHTHTHTYTHTHFVMLFF